MHLQVTSGEFDAVQEQAWLSDRLTLSASSGGDAEMHVLVARYRAPALILGRGQALRWSQETLTQQLGCPAVVRASGGGAVLAGPWLVSLSVVVSNGHPLARAGLHGAYRWWGRLHEKVMGLCGVHGAVARSPETLPPRCTEDAVEAVCFASLSPWEVTVGERKLCGLAQVRRARSMALVAGTHVARPPWESLDRLLNCPSVGVQMDARAIDMASLGSSMTATDLAETWAEQMQLASVALELEEPTEGSGSQHPG